MYCEGGEEQDHLEDQRTETDAEGPEPTLNERAIPLPRCVNVFRQRGISLLERRVREREVRIQLRALDGQAPFTARREEVNRRDECEEERDECSCGECIEPRYVDRAAADKFSSVADLARMSLRTYR